MEFTLLHTLVWLIPAFTFTTQELVNLSVTPRIAAECGEQVTLNCQVSSSGDGLSIKHMEWFQDHTSLCSVNSEGKIRNHTRSLSDFICEYTHGQLSLIFKRVQPLEIGNYTCKLQSNQGALHKRTRVELKECGIAEGDWTKDQLVCTFKNVYPDGDVHWFQGSHDLSNSAVRQETTKHVDEGGWLKIQSYLALNNSHERYNCSLRSTASGRYIASALVQNPESPVGVGRQELIRLGQNGVGSHGPVWTFLCISVFLTATLKCWIC